MVRAMSACRQAHDERAVPAHCAATRRRCAAAAAGSGRSALRAARQVRFARHGARVAARLRQPLGERIGRHGAHGRSSRLRRRRRAASGHWGRGSGAPRFRAPRMASSRLARGCDCRALACVCRLVICCSWASSCACSAGADDKRAQRGRQRHPPQQGQHHQQRRRSRSCAARAARVRATRPASALRGIRASCSSRGLRLHQQQVAFAARAVAARGQRAGDAAELRRAAGPGRAAAAGRRCSRWRWARGRAAGWRPARRAWVRDRLRRDAAGGLLQRGDFALPSAPARRPPACTDGKGLRQDAAAPRCAWLRVRCAPSRPRH